MLYQVTTYAIFIDTLEVEADFEEEAQLLAHESADYQYSHWFDADATLSEEQP
jgi:hypothetical protein